MPNEPFATKNMAKILDTIHSHVRVVVAALEIARIVLINYPCLAKAINRGG
jgi:hypothetical protein